MTSNILCKYYMNGACAYGDQCRFSHNRQDETSQVCKYYLQGNCAYGDRCRYEHSKPSWSSRGQPPAPSNYKPPPAVPKPPVGVVDSDTNPNWDDYMTPDEMDEFEQWQAEQDQVGPGGQLDDDVGDIMDPADIPLCSEYGATGQCSAGEDCLYVHGDMCEICGYFCVHPYNPDWTAQHQAACRQAMAAAAAGTQGRQQHQQPPPQQQQHDAHVGVAEASVAQPVDDAALSMETSAADLTTEAADVASAVDDSAPEVKTAVAAALDAVVHEAAVEEEESNAADVADKLAETHISS